MTLSPHWPAELDLDRSAEGYRTRAAVLMKLAVENPDSALEIEALAREWQNLAIQADWQEVMTKALEASDGPAS